MVESTQQIPEDWLRWAGLATNVVENNPCAGRHRKYALKAPHIGPSLPPNCCLGASPNPDLVDLVPELVLAPDSVEPTSNSDEPTPSCAVVPHLVPDIADF